MSNKNFKPLIKQLLEYNIEFKGYPHRRHRTGIKTTKSNKSLMLNKIINKEHLRMIKDAT